MNSALLICNNPEYVGIYEEVIGDSVPLYNVIPDKGDFRRRIRPNRVMCEDHFPKQTRNIDYSDIETEFFSSDHLYYADDGYKGFSDYSVVGEEYGETGFAPYAVAIHIVYFDEKNILRIAHFVSDSNDDISDPARKFAEAVKKLVEWNKTMKLDTVGIREFEADTTLHEVRAGVFDFVSVGTFRLKQDITVVDLRAIAEISPFVEGLEYLDHAINKQYLEKLNTEMSKSLRRSDSTLDYVPTQYIVDFIKSIEHNGEQEYDGIEYNSTTNPGGYNLAIFNPDLFECVSVSVYDIEKLQYTSKKVL